MIECGVYLITNTINGKRYIGQTNNWKRRQYQYRYSAKIRPNQVIHKAINKYGMNNFTFELVYECPDNPELLDRLECRAIKEYQPEYNIRSGGQNGYRHSKETKMKMSESNKNFKRYKVYSVTQPNGETFIWDNTIEMLCKQYDLSPQSIRRVVNGFADTHKGWIIEHINEEDRQRAELNRQNRSMKTGISLRHKTVILKSPEGTKVIIENIAQFCLEEGLSKGAISLVCKGRRQSHKGWTLYH